MSAANKYDWKHAVGDIAVVGTAVCEGLAQAQAAGVALPWHIAAGTLLAVSAIFSKISHSLTADALPPVVVAVGATPGSPAMVIPSTSVSGGGTGSVAP